MQKQKLIFLIVGIVLGLVAVVMINNYIKDADANTKRQAAKAIEKMRSSQAVVLVAKQDIPPNTPIQGAMLETAIVPREYVQPQAATSLDSVSGMITIAPIARGEQVSLTKLSSSVQQVKKRDLATITPMGKRAVAVTAENISDVIGLINPGDSVDLIAVLTTPQKGADGKITMQQTITPVFQNVLILAVGQNTDIRPTAQGKTLKDTSRDKSAQITVALDPNEANILTFLQEQGKIRIVLRSSQDTQITSSEPVTWESVFERIPSLRPPEEEKPKPVVVVEEESVEIYRGLNKEKIPLSK